MSLLSEVCASILLGVPAICREIVVAPLGGRARIHKRQRRTPDAALFARPSNSRDELSSAAYINVSILESELIAISQHVSPMDGLNI